MAVPVETRNAPGAATGPRGDLDIASQDWVAGLQSLGSSHEDCVKALHALLLRVAKHEVARRAGALQLRGPELEDVAQQATDDALMSIRAKVAGFRGESRFTTWAYRFVMFEVSTKMGRHFWRERRASMSDDGWDRLPDNLSNGPDAQSLHRELFAALRRAIDEDLTALQRRVFVAIALNEVPMDAFARELGANRNAVYKTLFDARRKLRASLVAAGYEPPYVTSGAAL
jgi:RNA polymerase sigma-70 factor (ECF subfamily)